MRAITGGIALLVALLIAGCGSGGGGSAAPSGEGGTTKLAVQETAGVPSAFVAFGIDKGFFEKQKLQIDLQPTQGGAATIPALVSGDIQVGGSNVVSLLLASSKDLPIRAIAAGTSASRTMIAVVSRSRSRRERSTTKPASATTSSTLPSSDGWIWKNGRSIARREPRATEPKPRTATMRTSMAPYTTYFSSRSLE